MRKRPIACFHLASSRSSQAWYMDFAVALLLFTFTLVVYFSYTSNFQKEEKGELDLILKDAKSISSSLASPGYPADWNNETVIRIGIADGHNVNGTKLSSFRKVSYNNTRRKFATPYEYFIFFSNLDGDVLNINGVCGVGNPIINTTFIVKSAYYYQDPADSFLKDFMNETFNADIYKGDDPSNEDDIDALMSNISKYQLVILEHPLLTASKYNTYNDEIEAYTSNGSLKFLMISGELVSAQDRELVGANFRKKSGQSSSQRTAIVNNSDQYLSLTVGQSMVFGQYYYAQNETAASPPSTDFKIIATYNQTDDNAIARWEYGNGTVYFFSDFDVSFFSGDFVDIVEETAKRLVEGTCTQIDSSKINPKKLVKTERYFKYNSKVVRMIVYVWQ